MLPAKGDGGEEEEGGHPEPMTPVKGNYILIPFRNLVYILIARYFR